MHRSSESVAALASALAKAQAELVNPEKSLTATIRSGRPGDGERSLLLPSAADRSFAPKHDQSRVPPRTPGNGYGRGGRKGETPVTLDPDQSAALRETLLTEVGNITSADL